jgi:uncharacterized SAM-binding protein YcdF (DUF218 family)
MPLWGSRSRPPVHRRESRRLFRMILLVLLAVGAWTGGLAWFARTMPSRPDASARRTDAAVVLTGGTLRFAGALELLAQDRADRLFVTGVHRDVDLAGLLRTAALPPGRAVADFLCCVEIGHDALDTAGNAAETARWLAGKDIRSIRLVTANYHMPRALLEFRTALPQLDIVPHPVFPERVRPGEWWRHAGTASVVANEYNKFLRSWLRVFLAETLGKETV